MYFRTIADECPESTTKKDLIAYLQRIALYCHQLNITSKVKADVQNVSGELIVSGLDSATSLIQAAKNLMNAVVLTVKASYVASTKYRKNSTGVERKSYSHKDHASYKYINTLFRNGQTNPTSSCVAHESSREETISQKRGS